MNPPPPSRADAGVGDERVRGTGHAAAARRLVPEYDSLASALDVPDGAAIDAALAGRAKTTVVADVRRERLAPKHEPRSTR